MNKIWGKLPYTIKFKLICMIVVTSEASNQLFAISLLESEGPQ